MTDLDEAKELLGPYTARSNCRRPTEECRCTRA